MTEKLLSDFAPLFAVGLTRLQAFKNPEPRDVVKIFGPTFDVICRSVDADPAQAAERIASWDPTTVTMETLHSAVREITRPQMADMSVARAKQESLDREMSRPLTPRELIHQERLTMPVTERSRDSLYSELFELRSGHEQVMVDGVAKLGRKLRDSRFDSPHPRVDFLQGELDRRDAILDDPSYELSEDESSELASFELARRMTARPIEF